MFKTAFLLVRYEYYKLMEPCYNYKTTIIGNSCKKTIFPARINLFKKWISNYLII